ncbi:MAG: hypothetical protein NC089_06985 [Bacteroides sp.]|nr:hypothetical protein [Bacteroides sp.]MCM1548406.1 hypothetical protein [Clostridium sp.]
MMETREKIQTIIQELETPERQSGKQIGERILGRKVADGNGAVSNCSLEIQQMQEHVEHNNENYVISLEEEPGGRLGFIRKHGYEYWRSCVGSVAEQQTAFNASVTRSINHLYNNMIILQQYADRQAGIIRSLEKELARQQFLNTVSEEKIKELQRRLNREGEGI